MTNRAVASTTVTAALVAKSGLAATGTPGASLRRTRPRRTGRERDVARHTRGSQRQGPRAKCEQAHKDGGRASKILLGHLPGCRCTA